MPSTQQPDWGTAVSHRAIALHREGRSWPAVGAELHLPPGLAYLVATGRPADGGHALNEAERAQLGDRPEPTQDLVNPPAHNPTSTRRVHEWIRRRATTELAPGKDSADA